MMSDIEVRSRFIRSLTVFGSIANVIVCIYAVALGVLNLIGSAAEPWLFLFYLLMPLPFYIRNVFARMSAKPERDLEQHEEPIWVWITALLGNVIAIGLGIWMFIYYMDWISKDKSLGVLEYIAAGLPVSMFIASSILLGLLFWRRQTNV